MLVGCGVALGAGPRECVYAECVDGLVAWVGAVANRGGSGVGGGAGGGAVGPVGR